MRFPWSRKRGAFNNTNSGTKFRKVKRMGGNALLMRIQTGPENDDGRTRQSP